MPLVTQNEYCKIHGQNPAWGSRLRIKERLVLVDDPSGTIDPKTKRIRVLIDSDATDLMNGFAKIVQTKQLPNSEATSRKLVPLPPVKTVEEITLLEAQRSKTFYEAEIKKFELEVKKGEYYPKQEWDNADFQKARIIRDNMLVLADRNADILAVMSDPHEIKLFLRKEITRGLEQAVQELKDIADDE